MLLRLLQLQSTRAFVGSVEGCDADIIRLLQVQVGLVYDV